MGLQLRVRGMWDGRFKVGCKERKLVGGVDIGHRITQSCKL